MRKLQKNNSKSGFALVELLVAVSIFAVVITVVYTTLYTAIKTYHRAQRELRINQEINQLLDRLSMELRNCYDSEYVKEEERYGFIGGAQSVSFFTIQNVYSESGIRKLLARIKYNFANEKLFKKLQLDENVFLDEGNFQEEELISDIKELSLQYLYFKRVYLEGEYKYEWLSEWTDKSLIPKGIRINITRYDPETNMSVSFKRNILLEQGQVGVQE